MGEGINKNKGSKGGESDETALAKEPSQGPVNIISAIAKAMGQIGKLSKDNKNVHGNYKFTSIDDFVEATSKVCSENGLITIQDEVSCGIVQRENKGGEIKPWIEMKYSFVVIHVSGGEIGPFTRTVSIPLTGAQSYGAAQSYCLKNFLKSLFQIATGDNDDPDFRGEENLGVRPREQSNRGQRNQPSQASRPKRASQQKTSQEPFLSNRTRGKLLELSQESIAFGNAEGSEAVFTEWVKLASTGNKELDHLTESQAQGMIKFLTTKTDISSWDPDHVNALIKAKGIVQASNNAEREKAGKNKEPVKTEVKSGGTREIASKSKEDSDGEPIKGSVGKNPPLAPKEKPTADGKPEAKTKPTVEPKTDPNKKGK